MDIEKELVATLTQDDACLVYISVILLMSVALKPLSLVWDISSHLGI